MWFPSSYLATGLSVQLKNGSFNGEKPEDVKGMQEHAEVLPVSLVPSASLVHWLASASTRTKMPVS